MINPRKENGMKSWLQVVIWILIGLLAAGLVTLIAKPDPGVPITLSQPPTPTRLPMSDVTPTLSDILVQIGGQVVNPGVYTLAPYSGLDDLISKAGGLLPQADLVRINYAAIIQNGDYFYIPEVDEVIPETANNAPINSSFDENTGIQYPLDLNTASQDELESLPGIGPARAADIIFYREVVGAFSDIDELINVEGIGTATLESLREYLVITP